MAIGLVEHKTILLFNRSSYEPLTIGLPRNAELISSDLSEYILQIKIKLAEEAQHHCERDLILFSLVNALI